MQTKVLPANFDCLAPDGSQVRLLCRSDRGSSIHCTLPAGKVSKSTCNRTVEEIWYFLDGEGEIWRKLGDQETVTRVARGITITLPAGTHFQFRGLGPSALAFLCVTMPPWPGEDEAVFVKEYWPSTV